MTKLETGKVATKAAADRLKKARMKAGYHTASDAARRIGVKPVTYTAHENGGREFYRDACLFYAEKFKVDPFWLMFGGPDPSDNEPTTVTIPEIAQDLRHLWEREESRTKFGLTMRGDKQRFIRNAKRSWSVPRETVTESLGCHPDDKMFFMEVTRESFGFRRGELVLAVMHTMPPDVGLIIVNRGRSLGVVNIDGYTVLENAPEPIVNYTNESGQSTSHPLGALEDQYTGTVVGAFTARVLKQSFTQE